MRGEGMLRFFTVEMGFFTGVMAASVPGSLYNCRQQTGQTGGERLEGDGCLPAGAASGCSSQIGTFWKFSQ